MTSSDFGVIGNDGLLGLLVIMLGPLPNETQILIAVGHHCEIDPRQDPVGPQSYWCLPCRNSSIGLKRPPQLPNNKFATAI